MARMGLEVRLEMMEALTFQAERVLGAAVVIVSV